MRIKDKITQGELTWYFNNSFQVLLSEKYGARQENLLFDI